MNQKLWNIVRFWTLKNMVAKFFGNFPFDGKICGFMNDFDVQNFRIFFRNYFKHFFGIKSRALSSLSIVLFKIRNSILYCNNYLTIWLFWTTAGKLNQTLIRHFNSDKPVLTECYKYQPRYFIDNFNRKWTGWLQIQGQFQDQGQ